jgi:hypothetical protein
LIGAGISGDFEGFRAGTYVDRGLIEVSTMIPLVNILITGGDDGLEDDGSVPS